MIVCKKCGKENSVDSKFCMNCGNNLEGKIKCPRCQEMVDDNSKFCPHCGTDLIGDPIFEQMIEKRVVVNDYRKKVDPEKRNKTKNIIFSVISNSSVIVLCLIMSLIMLLGSVSTTSSNVGFDQKEKTFRNDFFDYAGASFKVFGEYTFEDFVDNYREYQDEDITEAELMEKINLLNMIMFDELDDYTVLTRTFIVITFLLVLAMIVMPLVLLGFSIYDLVKFRRTKLHKKFLFMNLLLSFLAMIAINLSNMSLGAGFVFYIILSGLGLITAYVLDILTKERKFVVMKFSLRLVTLIGLFILVFLSFGKIGRFSTSDFKDKKAIQSVAIGDIIDYVAFIGESDIEYPELDFSGIMVGQEMEEANIWIVYFSLLIPLLTVASGAFVVCGFLTETKRDIGLKEKPTHTTLYLWLAFTFKVLAIASVVVLSAVFNYFTNEFMDEKIKFELSISMIVCAVLLLMLAIYQTVTNRLQQNEE